MQERAGVVLVDVKDGGDLGVGAARRATPAYCSRPIQPAAEWPSAGADGVAPRGRLGRLVGAGRARAAGISVVLAVELARARAPAERGHRRVMTKSHARRAAAAGVPARAPLLTPAPTPGRSRPRPRPVGAAALAAQAKTSSRVPGRAHRAERAGRGRGESRGAARRRPYDHRPWDPSQISPLLRSARVRIALLVRSDRRPSGTRRRGRARTPSPGRPSTSATRPQPDAVGIRASMPGAAKGCGSRCASASSTARPRRVGRRRGRRLGLARVASRGAAVESGWSFTFPRPAKAVALRGVVRSAGGAATARRAHEVATEAGHRSSAGADPAGYSAATCALGLSEQPRVVRDDPGHAQPFEAADPPAVVDRPHVELAAGLPDGT